MIANPRSNCDPARCPLCGESNQCARAADPDSTRCWCGPEKFPRDLLDRLPESAVGRACVCQQCLRDHREISGK